MNQTLVYIGDSLLDLYPDTIVALTKKANEVGSITTRNLNYTNQFKAPFTPNNDEIFGNARNTSSGTTVPYRRQTVKLVQNGIEIVSNGIAILKKTNKSYELFILSGAADFFEAIKNLKLSNIDLSDYNTTWDAATITSLMNETVGVVSPVMDYGKFAYPAGLNSNASIDTDTYLPSVYYKTVLDKIFSEAGYTYTGTPFTSNKLTKMIIAFSRSRFQYAEEFADERRFSGSVSGTQSIVNPTTAQPVNFPVDIIANADYWDGTNKYTTNDANIPVNIIFQVKVSFTLNITVTGGTVDIQVYNSVGGLILTTHSNKGTGIYTYNELTVDCYDTSFTQVRVINNSGTPTVIVTDGSVLFEPSTDVLRNASFHVYFQYLLPDLTQTDFIKDFMIMNHCIFWEDNKVITAITLDEIVENIAEAPDWTEKRAIGEEEISFSPFDYAQRNYYRFKDGDDLTNENYGSAYFDIDNENLDNEKTVYRSVSNPTHTAYPFAGSMLMARIPAYDPSERSYRIQFTGTSGTCNIGVNGVNYLATFNTTLGTTASDFVTLHAAALALLGITLTVVSGAEIQFLDQSDVIIITSTNVTGTLNSTPTESSAQKQTDSSTIANNPGIRYLLVRDRYTNDPTIGNETNTLTTSFKVAYFFDPDQNDNMFWDLTEISSFTEALQRSKIVTRNYLLTETDIEQIDFQKPIFDTDSHYLLNTVGPFVPGRLTKVEMLKL